MKILYQNWSTVIFMGFYESILYNSDTEYYINEHLKNSESSESYEIDWVPYQTEISQAATDLLNDYCVNEDNIIKNMQFINLSSPQYYNYDTDRLNIEIDVNLTKLKKYIKQNKTDFNQYLKDNFTSYDGFISFVENNYNSFFEDYKINKNKCIQVMIEYYILHCIYNDNWQGMKKQDDYNTPYHWELFEKNQEIQFNNLIKVKEIA